MFGKQNLQIFFNNNLFGEASKESVSIGKANSWFKYLIEIINKDSKKRSSGVTVFFEKLPWGSEVSLGNYLRLTDMLIGISSTYFIDLVRRKRSILKSHSGFRHVTLELGTSGDVFSFVFGQMFAN